MSISEEFQAELKRNFRYYGYKWSKGKEKSCEWIMEQIDTGKVLDIGGTSWLLERLSEKSCECTYFDAFPPSSKNPPYRVVTGDIHHVADLLPQGHFEHISLRHTLEHALNPLFVLWQVNALLSAGGRAYIIVPAHSRFWVWFYTHFNCLPIENWRMLFYRAGFSIEEESTGHWDDDQCDENFKEHRFVLRQDTRSLRLEGEPAQRRHTE